LEDPDVDGEKITIIIIIIIIIIIKWGAVMK